MSTTTPYDDTAEQPPSLIEVLADWTRRTPDADASTEVIATWFELKADLLAPITSDPTHPDHVAAQSFAARAVHSANTLRSKENER
ncbi:hypothetical protein LFM09_27545 [Lentzea alba]|uniref:hypothetical protein n=1 Tax=Lentzea alba TaxID=2714351 RepID=UPI0039BEFB50